ncbi:hypothetical protein BKA69DRAFT_1125312 [Paraphysoderma sedebokerense]|nr:hypothetical protein BKA69DRAFT_1125312 [Paraphysoderma sedebokerense]
MTFPNLCILPKAISSSFSQPTLKLSSSSLCTIPYIIGLPGITDLNVAAIVEIDIPPGFDVDRIIGVRAWFNGSSNVTYVEKQHETVVDTKPVVKVAKVIWHRANSNLGGTNGESHSDATVRRLGEESVDQVIHSSEPPFHPDQSSPECSPNVSDPSNWSDSRPQKRFQCGINRIPFTFSISHNLPPSVREPTVTVFYTLTVYMHIATSGRSLFGSKKRKMIHVSQEIVLPRWNLQNYIDGFQAPGRFLSNRIIQHVGVDRRPHQVLQSNYRNDQIMTPTPNRLYSSRRTVRRNRHGHICPPSLPVPPPLTYDLNVRSSTVQPGKALSFHLTLTTPYPDMIVDVLHVGLKMYTDTVTMDMEVTESEYVCRWKIRGLDRFWKVVNASDLRYVGRQNNSDTPFDNGNMVQSSTNMENDAPHSGAPPSYCPFLDEVRSDNSDTSINRLYILSQTFHFPLPDYLTPSSDYRAHQVDSSPKIHYKFKIKLSCRTPSSLSRSKFNSVSVNPNLSRLSLSPPSNDSTPLNRVTSLPTSCRNQDSHPRSSPTANYLSSSLLPHASKPNRKPRRFIVSALQKLSYNPTQLTRLNFPSFNSIFKSFGATTIKIQAEVEVASGSVEGMNLSVDELIKRYMDHSEILGGCAVTSTDSPTEEPPEMDFGLDFSHVDVDGTSILSEGNNESRDYQEELDPWWS